MSHEKACGQVGQNVQVDVLNEDKQSAKTNALVCAQIAVAYDQAFKNLHGNADDAAFIISSRINNVAAFYIQEFEIDYKLVEIYESGFGEITSESNYTPCGSDNENCGVGSILGDFKEWGEGNSNVSAGFSSNPDLATFFTGRRVTENFGYSYLAAICVNRGYNWVEEDNGYDEQRKTNLWLHEIGHTWGASHARQNNRNYMMGKNVPSTDFIRIHRDTYNAIINHKSTRTCLSNGSCSDESPPVTNPTNIFTLYPFLNNFVDKDNCGGISIDVYNRVSYAFAIVTVNNQIVMYSSYYGDVFCYGSDCLDSYGLTEPDESYSCDNTNPPPGATCTDGIKNGNETGVDCGGSTCESCPATCTDGIKNGNETGVDCGGSTCNSCPATCTDGIKNGNETGVDCGGSTCESCPSTCTDGIKNGNEVGEDCGGSTCESCPATCTDGIKNGNETGLDCGGSNCDPCSTGGNTPAIFTAYPFINNYADYNNCNGIIIKVYDYGSYAFALIETNTSITLYGDFYDGVYCSGSNCSNNFNLNNPAITWSCGEIMPPATCNDGIQNGDETAIDCGGSDCNACAPTGNTPAIFSGYPFLNNYVDYINCNNTNIKIYDFGNYAFALIETPGGTLMYSDYYDGVFCSGSSCAEMFNLNNADMTWACGNVDPPAATCTDGIQNGSETNIDCGGTCNACTPVGNAPSIFNNYPFLGNYVDYDNCNGTSIEVFDFGHYAFAIIETINGSNMYSDFYDGIYCAGYECADTYSLNNVDDFWGCGQTFYKTKLDDPINNQSLHIYPNPASHQIQFKFDALEAEARQWKIVNHLGAELMHGKTFNTNQTISLDACADGLYILCLTDTSGNRLQRSFIISK